MQSGTRRSYSSFESSENCTLESGKAWKSINSRHISIADGIGSPSIKFHPNQSFNEEQGNKAKRVTKMRRQSSPHIRFTDPDSNGESITKPTRRRLIEKDGKVNVRSRRVPRRRYFSDAFTTAIDARWKWVIFAFLFFYVLTWTMFGTLWWLIVEFRSSSKVKCFTNVSSWTDAFLFSVETQQTIGYGGRMITNQCPEAIIILLLQSVVGCLLDAVLLGLIFAKIARPGKRSGTIYFSENAVVCSRNGKMYLVFQVGDARKRQLLEAHIRLHLVRSVTTTEGRVIPFNQENLRIAFDFLNPYFPDYDTDRVLLLYPTMIYHPIDHHSPFYGLSPTELYKCGWEVIAVLEGIVEATGCTVQAKTSYLSDEIIWGYDFECSTLTSHWNDETGLRYPLSAINEIFPVDLPKCSAKEYYETWQMDALSKTEDK